MANNNYYYNYDQEHQVPSHIQPHHAPSPHQSPAPSYHTSYPPPVSSYSGTPAPDRPPRTSPSPFDTVFDDNAYPASANSRQNLADMPSHNEHYHQQDTGYYGGQQDYANPYIQRRPSNPSDDIPLQDRQPKDAPESGFDDHVYDAPQREPSKRKKKRKVQLGQLGMFGAEKKRIPFVVYAFTVAQIGVFIGEIINNAILTGSPIMIKPQFNFMIGPSTPVMMNMGARFGPCMHRIKELEELKGSSFTLPCPSATSFTAEDQQCPLHEVCGFGATKDDDPDLDGVYGNGPVPNQWWRFIVPIFMHAGLIHIAFNMLLQLTLAREMEMAIGSLRFFIVYVSAGIFGFVLGGNFAGPMETSTGASGALFGILALVLLDLLYSWKDRKNPVKDLMFILVDIIISFVLGLLPGLDNFSHIGGFLIGLLLGICVLHSPNALRLKIGQDAGYSTVPGDAENGTQSFLKNPVGFFKGRKPLWWAWWLIRASALVLAIVVFIVLINNFYQQSHTCSWCKYLSCIPVYNWCDMNAFKTTTDKSTRADLPSLLFRV